MVASAQGVDISKYQNVYTASDFKAYSFAFVKATEGTTSVDQNFGPNWASAKASGIHRGAYHELTTDSAAVQAAHFLQVVKGAGVAPGDMLAVVVSDYPGITGQEALTFLEACKAALPHNPVLIYSDLSALAGFTACKGYPLWIAAYQSSWPQTSGWDCKFWQWSDGSGKLDHDAYNGDAAALDAWVKTYESTPVAAPKPPVTTPTPVKAATGVQGGWKFCSKCKSLFYGPDEKVSKCPDGGTHVSLPGGYTYDLNYTA